MPLIHQAVLEETDIRIAELKKDAYEFKRDIVVGAENMRTGKVSRAHHTNRTPYTIRYALSTMHHTR